MLESEELSALIADIYDAALDAALWPRALEGTRDFVRGCAANFYWQDISTESAGVFYCAGIDPAYLQLYFEKYAKMNPLYPAAAFIEPGEVFNSSDVVPASEFVQTRFYHEWMRPQGMVDSVCANLEKSVVSVAALAVIRGQQNGLVDEEARRRMRLIVPHMLRAPRSGTIGREQMEKAALPTRSAGSPPQCFWLMRADASYLSMSPVRPWSPRASCFALDTAGLPPCTRTRAGCSSMPSRPPAAAIRRSVRTAWRCR